MSLSLQARQVGEIVVIRCRGRIVEGPEASALRQHVGDVLRDAPFIILHLAEVDFIDSGGLGLLVRLLSRTQAAGGDLKLCAVTARVHEVLRITRLASIFDAYPTEAEAIAAFYDRSRPGAVPRRFDNEILCVEPSADVLSYVSELLRQAGYGVMTSANLPDALVLLRASTPKLVVIGARLRTARDTWTAGTFNTESGALPVVELPADFSASDAGDAGQRLLDQVRALLQPGGAA